MSIPKKVQLMIDGELADCLVRIDGNGEWACYSKPDERNPKGRAFFFSPKGVDHEGNEVTYTLAEQVRRHNKANAEKPVFAEDAAPLVDEELQAWLGGEDLELEEDAAEEDAAEEDVTADEQDLADEDE